MEKCERRAPEKIGCHIHFLRLWRLSRANTLRGIIRITMSVKIFIDAIEKYEADKLLQPSGNRGSHANVGSLGHSKA